MNHSRPLILRRVFYSDRVRNFDGENHDYKFGQFLHKKLQAQISAKAHFSFNNLVFKIFDVSNRSYEQKNTRKNCRLWR